MDAEQTRLRASKATTAARKSQFGQFFTPLRIGKFMAELFSHDSGEVCRLLDAGAGIGSLTAAFLDRIVAGKLDFKHLEVDAFEVDERLHMDLLSTLDKYQHKTNFESSIRGEDFIHSAVNSICGNLFSQGLPRYTHAILNPPYKKIRSDSAHRTSLRQAGIETVNLYSAFVALSLALLEEDGELVAIIPRSFANGPYYRPFREYLLERAAIRHIHLFESRSKAFKHDEVLQENVIILLQRAADQGPVTITTSTDGTFSDIRTHTYPFSRIVFPDDPEHFIHVPTSPTVGALERSAAIRWTLDEIGVKVSTGPVVEFRLKEHLRRMPVEGTVPLLYPAHFSDQSISWPKPDSTKPNAIHRNSETEKWLYPTGFYCVVRRFSSKEERRRILARIVKPQDLSGAEVLGFENHLNVFHEGRRGLSEELAYGLVTFLNSNAVDESFRRFNGHTQVNATDLRLMKFPSRENLILLGKWAMKCTEAVQPLIDKQLEGLSA